MSIEFPEGSWNLGHEATRAPPAAAPARSRERDIRASRRLWLVVCVLVAARTLVSLHDIDLPGIQQDETLFVNAATLRLPGVDISNSFLGIPLMIVPYTGALKAWIFDPLFAVFGTSVIDIRSPAVLIVGAGLLLLFAALKDLINRPVALLSVALLCFDNSVFWLTRDDVGPSAIEFALKCAVLFCAARFARSRRQRWIVLLLASLAVGVFNKLNFIWVVNAALAVSLLVMARHRRSLRARWRLVASWLGGLAVLYVCWGLYYFIEHISTSQGPGDPFALRWPEFRVGTSGILSGTWFCDYALAPLDSRMVVVWIVLALFGVGAVASVIIARVRNLAVAWIGLATVLVALQSQGGPGSKGVAPTVVSSSALIRGGGRQAVGVIESTFAHPAQVAAHRPLARRGPTQGRLPGRRRRRQGQAKRNGDA